MGKLKAKVSDIADSLKHKQEVSARRTLLEELFQDYYAQRHKLYRMNFFRGIFFGFGSVLGATLVVALVVWLLTTLMNLPIGGELIESIRNSLQKTSVIKTH